LPVFGDGDGATVCAMTAGAAAGNARGINSRPISCDKRRGAS
jgi:hypothetical protein